MSNILKLKGAHILTNNEQKAIKGGIIPPGINDCSGWTKPMQICEKNETCEITQLPDGSFTGICV